jgi:hypothetical protein
LQPIRREPPVVPKVSQYRITSSALDVGNSLHHAHLLLQRARLIASALTRDRSQQLRRRLDR